jgi:peptide/nickel transport system substrate-binding protein
MLSMGPRFSLVACVALLLASCAPTPGGARPEAGRSELAAPPKTITMGSFKEPFNGIVLGLGVGSSIAELTSIFHAGLTTYDGQGNLLPRIAQKVPRVDDSDWTIGPDGTMEVTWKLRPDVRWHDGTPLSAEDFAFGIQASVDPRSPRRQTGDYLGIAQAFAPDAQTLVVRWKTPYVYADRAGPADQPALPRHLLADLYGQGDLQAFDNSSYWTTDFVGLGPYRMGDWVLGSHTEALASDGYFLGRPRIDRIVVRYYGDPQGLAQAVLAGAVDVVGIGSLRDQDVPPIKTAWEPQGLGAILRMTFIAASMGFQFRDPAAPWADVRVRRALAHLLDRQVLAEALGEGLSRPADAVLEPDDPVYGLLERGGFMKYAYDVAQAERLFAEAGWARGPDGVLQRNGQRFGIQVSTLANSPAYVARITAVADQLKLGGLEPTVIAIPSNTPNPRETESRTQGLHHRQSQINDAQLQVLTTALIPSPETQWQGTNVMGYSNPAYDRLYDRFVSAFELPARQALKADLLRITAEDVAQIPLFYTSGTAVIVYRKGITGPGPVSTIYPVAAWNIHLWQAS